MKQILVIGSTCVDIIINIDHLPKTEEDIHPTSQTLALGGCAYNVAYLLKLLQAPFTLISPVGTGFYGEYVKKELEAGGFELCVQVPDRENGCCYCLVEASGERTFMSYHGAEYTFSKDWMKPFENRNFSMVYICGLEIEEPTGDELLAYLEQHKNRQIFFAPGPRGIQITREKWQRIFSLSPILHINQPEALALSKTSTIQQAAEILQQQTHNTVIITLGERGTYCLEQSGTSYLLPGFPTQVVDTIGAGDAHIGTVMGALSFGYRLKDAIRMANQVASLVVSEKGASLSKQAFDRLMGTLKPAHTDWPFQ